jgi:hypothetical protein
MTVRVRQWIALVLSMAIGYYMGSLRSLELPDAACARQAEEPVVSSHTSHLLSQSHVEINESIATMQETRQIQAHESATASETPHNLHVYRHPICALLSVPIPSAASLWVDHLQKIHAATHLKQNDIRFDFADFTAELLHLITPRLPKSTMSLTQDWTAVRRVLDVGWKRYEYLKAQASGVDMQNVTEPPPLRILTMGGSVLRGQNCRATINHVGVKIRLPFRECTWSNRLQQFINEYTGVDLVRVSRISAGGTNSQVGLHLLKYGSVSAQDENPDILINGYSTNDMHILTILEAQRQQVTLEDQIFTVLQDFIRTIADSCNPPLFIHANDYLGNEQRGIIETMALTQAINRLAQYYGFGSLSFANMVRDLVYGDTHEYWFSPNGWYIPGKQEMQREIHPLMGMHISMAWTVAYHMLETVTTFCSLEPVIGQDALPYNETYMNKLIQLQRKIPQVPGRPQVPPKSLPPPLTPALSLEDISEKWRMADSTASEHTAVECTSSTGFSTRCHFSWLSGLRPETDRSEYLGTYFGKYSRLNEGWLIENGEKVGWVASNISNVMELAFPPTNQTVYRRLVVFYMQSYGDKWANSQMLVQVSSDHDNGDGAVVAHNLTEVVLDGFHAKNTSETRTVELDLKMMYNNETLIVRMTLINGTTCKLMGLALCK